MSDVPSRVQEILEFQRAAIAGEIHDSLMPYLFATKISLESLLARLVDPVRIRESDTDLGDVVPSELTYAIASLQDAMAIGRQLLGDLHPAELSTLSWHDHLQACFERLGNTSDTALYIEGNFDSFISDDAKRLAGRRIAQEAVRNAFRHGNAKSIVVTVETIGEQQVVLSIIDDGEGFDPALMSCGYGLRIMQSRAQAVGASLVIDSRIGGPTKIVLIADR